MVTQLSRAGRGGIVTEPDRPRVCPPQTEPTGGRLPTAMRKNSNTEEIYIYMAPMVMDVGILGNVWVLYYLNL